MKLLVTGGAGFVGSNFIIYWLNKYPDDFIVNLDVLTYAGNLENLQKVQDQLNYKFVKGDICDERLVNELTGKTDIIVNFAAESHVDRSVMDSSDFICTNVEGARVLLDAAKKYNTRFHHISTDEVFGHLRAGDPAFRETSAYSPRSPYSASKAAADHLVMSYFYTHKIPATISNCSNNYGSYQFPEKLIPLFITNLLENKKVPVYGNGKNIRDWIHVDDHSRGVDMIIKNGRLGETYCLGGGNELANIEITGMILKIIGAGKDMIEYVKDRPGHDFRYAINYSKAERELGWKPEIDFGDGLRKTIEWYKSNREWWERIKNGKYKEYYKKQYGKT